METTSIRCRFDVYFDIVSKSLRLTIPHYCVPKRDTESRWPEVNELRMAVCEGLAQLLVILLGALPPVSLAPSGPELVFPAQQTRRPHKGRGGSQRACLPRPM